MGVIIISFSSSPLILPRICMHQSLARMPLCPSCRTRPSQTHLHHACSCQCSQFLLANLLLIRNLMADSCANCFGASANIYQSAPIRDNFSRSKQGPAKPGQHLDALTQPSFRNFWAGPGPSGPSSGPILRELDMLRYSCAGRRRHAASSTVWWHCPRAVSSSKAALQRF